MISAITTRLALSSDLMSAKTASMALIGLQGLSSESEAVCGFLAALTTRLDTFDGQVYLFI